MKVLGISGSPRKGGNSEILLDKALEGARSRGVNTEKIVLNELKFASCQECGGCDKTGRCVIDDDMCTIYKKLEEAETIILASPIFFGSLPAQVKAMIDRYQCRWIAKYVLGQKDVNRRTPRGCTSGSKRGCLILVSGSNRDRFFKNAESIVKNFFAVLGVEFKESLYYPNVDKKAKILEHPDYLKRAFELGKNLL